LSPEIEFKISKFQRIENPVKEFKIIRNNLFEREFRKENGTVGLGHKSIFRAAKVRKFWEI
jgi:hypothetical protein